MYCLGRAVPLETPKPIPFWSACSAFQHGRLYRPYTARTQVAAHKVVSEFMYQTSCPEKLVNSF